MFCFQMSMEGVRMLAKALEDSGSRGVAHVYVHSEGRIDALGRKKERETTQVRVKVVVARLKVSRPSVFAHELSPSARASTSRPPKERSK